MQGPLMLENKLEEIAHDRLTRAITVHSVTRQKSILQISLFHRLAIMTKGESRKTQTLEEKKKKRRIQGNGLTIPDSTSNWSLTIK